MTPSNIPANNFAFHMCKFYTHSSMKVSTSYFLISNMAKKPSADRIAHLSQGIIESQNLMDGLAVDFNVLLGSVFPEHSLRIDNSMGITKRMSHAAVEIRDQVGFDCFDTLCTHRSDTVRGMAAYVLALQPLPLSVQLTRVKPLADDPHFGVREWAWLATRPAVAASLDEALLLLQPWVHDPSVYVRRFAVEVTRPRGVWCTHIPQLKSNPHLALPLLDPLKSAPEKYVQDSVSNWLNDASKSKSGWVRDVCARWTAESSTPETSRICRRALRTLRGK